MTENIETDGNSLDEDRQLISIPEKRKLRKKKAAQEVLLGSDLPSAKAESDQNKVPEAANQEFPGQEYYETEEDFSKFNRYQRDKTYAQGLLNVAIFTENATSLKTVVIGGLTSPMSFVILVMLIINLVLQLLVGAGLAIRHNTKEDSQIGRASKVNRWITVGTFLILANNVLIVAFKV